MERREFLAEIAKLAKAGAGLSGVAIAARTIALLREVSPELMAVVALKDQIIPNLSSPIFNTKLVYPRIDHASFPVFAIGDSNQYGSYRYESNPSNRPIAPIDFFCGDVNDKERSFGRVLSPQMLAIPGKNTMEIMDQLSDAKLKAADEPVGILYHGGGDDFMSLVKKYSWELLEKLANNPKDLSAIPLLEDANRTIDNVGRNVLHTFQKLDRYYGDKIGYITLIGTSNLSEVPSIQIGGEKRGIDPSRDQYAKFLASQLSTRLHNSLVSAGESFQQRSRIPLLGIDTINFGSDRYIGDEHFNDGAKKDIGKRIASKVEFTGKPIIRRGPQ